jgi:hypothetical protein
MSARITIDLKHVHPVFDGRWHRLRLARMPAQGEQIITYCGVTETADFFTSPPDFIPQTCWPCDLVYRQEENIPIQPDHPGLRASTQPTPHPRRHR